MNRDPDVVACWSCPHDVDDHDVLARCLDPSCACGWEATHTARHPQGPVRTAHQHH